MKPWPGHIGSSDTGKLAHWHSNTYQYRNCPATDFGTKSVPLSIIKKDLFRDHFKTG